MILSYDTKARNRVLKYEINLIKDIHSSPILNNLWKVVHENDDCEKGQRRQQWYSKNNTLFRNFSTMYFAITIFPCEFPLLSMKNDQIYIIGTIKRPFQKLQLPSASTRK